MATTSGSKYRYHGLSTPQSDSQYSESLLFQDAMIPNGVIGATKPNRPSGWPPSSWLHLINALRSTVAAYSPLSIPRGTNLVRVWDSVNEGYYLRLFTPIIRPHGSKVNHRDLPDRGNDVWVLFVLHKEDSLVSSGESLRTNFFFLSGSMQCRPPRVCAHPAPCPFDPGSIASVSVRGPS